MVDIHVSRSPGTIRVSAEGHALFDRKGQDLACCAVSTLLQAFRNGIKAYSGATKELEQDSGRFLMVIRQPDAAAELLTGVLQLNLKVLRDEFPTHIKMTAEEDHGRSQYS